jgi:signal transduction histidine kinase
LERASIELTQAYRKLQDSVEQLRRADRLSVLGQLSAGLAHEIKNPLASMKGSVEILASEFPADHDKHEFVEILGKELDRLNKVLGEFLQFARPPRPDRRPCDLREVLDSIRALCSREARRQGVTIELEYEPSLPELELDAAQVQQAFLNIVLNGIQAMPSGGCLSISVARRDNDIGIEVRDEGSGVAPENHSRIFDPFFTTKDGGTGLGMATARNLIQAHGGDIRLIGTEGEGATFLISLPMRSMTS